MNYSEDSLMKYREIFVSELENQLKEKHPNVVIQASLASSVFELYNTECKRKYLRQNVEAFHDIVTEIYGYGGMIGTGYPFYLLTPKFRGVLPIIPEQLRYNDELICEYEKFVVRKYLEGEKVTVWPCESCLKQNIQAMPNLKVICKRCTQIPDDIQLRPRKVINRMPDIDLWLVCDSQYVSFAQHVIMDEFMKRGMRTSDVDPIRSIQEVSSIALSLAKNENPGYYLPMDVHIISCEELIDRLQKLPGTFQSVEGYQIAPYLPIHPISLRKVWQYDDDAYNFDFDFLTSFTPRDFTGDLKEELMKCRKFLVEHYSNEQLYHWVLQSGGNAVARRFSTEYDGVKVFRKAFDRRIDSWKK